MIAFTLGRKKPQGEISPAVAEKQQEKLNFSRTAWLKESQQSDLTDAFSVMRNEITSIKPKDTWESYQEAAYFETLDAFDHLRNHWLSVDLNLVINDEGSEMYQILNRYLPFAVNEFHKQTILHGAHTAWTSGSYIHKESLGQSLAKIFLEMTYQVVAIEKRLRIHKIVPSVTFDLREAKTFRVPSTLVDNDVRERIESISLLWQAAIAKVNSVEDIYFLEQANSVYVPEAVKMYESFKLASPQVKEKAKEMLLEQLVLVEEEVSKILNNVMEDNLNAMQAQVNFLRAKTNKELTGAPAPLELTEVGV